MIKMPAPAARSLAPLKSSPPDSPSTRAPATHSPSTPPRGDDVNAFKRAIPLPLGGLAPQGPRGQSPARARAYSPASVPPPPELLSATLAESMRTKGYIDLLDLQSSPPTLAIQTPPRPSPPAPAASGSGGAGGSLSAASGSGGGNPSARGPIAHLKHRPRVHSENGGSALNSPRGPGEEPHGLHGELKVQLLDGGGFAGVKSATVIMAVGEDEVETPPAPRGKGPKEFQWNQEHEFSVDFNSPSKLYIKIVDAESRKRVGRVNLLYTVMARRKPPLIEAVLQIPESIRSDRVVGQLHVVVEFVHDEHSVGVDTSGTYARYAMRVAQQGGDGPSSARRLLSPAAPLGPESSRGASPGEAQTTWTLPPEREEERGVACGRCCQWPGDCFAAIRGKRDDDQEVGPLPPSAGTTPLAPRTPSRSGPQAPAAARV